MIGERCEFFFTATGIIEQKSAMYKRSPEESLQYLIDMIRNMNVPVFVIDQYVNIIAANMITIKFFNFPMELIEVASHFPHGYNLMRVEPISKISSYARTYFIKSCTVALE